MNKLYELLEKMSSENQRLKTEIAILEAENSSLKEIIIENIKKEVRDE